MCEYIVIVNSHINTADGLDNLIQQAQHQREILSFDTAEIGKHTVLYICLKKIKQNFPTKYWVVFIKSVRVIKKTSIHFASCKAEGGRTAVGHHQNSS